MDVIKRFRPGQSGTKRLQREYGDRLLFVRYRHDQELQRHFTTVELFVDEAPRTARTKDERRLLPRPNRLVQIRIAYGETELRTQVKAAGGKWDPEQRRWILPYGAAERLGLKDRLRNKLMSIIGNCRDMVEIISIYRYVPTIGLSV